jgi:hypothetical protein
MIDPLAWLKRASFALIFDCRKRCPSWRLPSTGPQSCAITPLASTQCKYLSPWPVCDSDNSMIDEILSNRNKLDCLHNIRCIPHAVYLFVLQNALHVDQALQE